MNSKSNSSLGILTYEEILSEFDSKFIGSEMKDTKQKVINAVNYFAKKRAKFAEAKKNGEEVPEEEYPCMNMLFFGAPGTGKTTIAHLVADLMNAKGVLPTNKVHDVQARDLIDGRVGGLHEKFEKEVAKAVEGGGGVLLIDEIQALNQEYRGGNLAQDFMRDVVGTINNNRSNLCVILCGYENDVNEIVKMDAGGPRRFPIKLKLESYGIETLMLIFEDRLAKDGKKLADGVREKVMSVIEADMKAQGNHFGNAGYIRDELISNIDEQYEARGGTDNIYTIDDVLSAFPEKEHQTE